jgi:hypothetical protein
MNPQSTINISDGYVRGLEGREEVTFNISGGDVDPILRMEDYSTANIGAGNYLTIEGRGHSSINLSGGQFDDVSALENSSLSINWGQFIHVGVLEESSLNISGGTFEHVMASGWGPAAQISGGSIQRLLLENSVLDISGGEIYSLGNMNPQSTINIRDGYVRGLEGRQEVTFNITGGDVDPELFMQDYSTANISAGNYLTIEGRGHSSISLSGGTAEHIALWESATGEISGGIIQELFATGNSIIDIFGSEILWFLCADDFSVVNM